MKKLLLAFLVLISISSFASALSLYPYIGAGVGSTSYTTSSGDTSSTKSAGIGFSILGGAAFTRHIAAEVAYTSYGKINNTDDYVSALELYLKGVIPVTYQFHLYGKIGFASTTAHETGSSNDTGSGLAWALGGSFKLMHQVAIFGQYQADEAKVGGANLVPSMWSIGVKYSFN